MIRFETESGSVYDVDFENHRYRKVLTTIKSAVSTFGWESFVIIKSRFSPAGDFQPDDTIRVGRQYMFANFDNWSRTGIVVSVDGVKA